MADDVQFTLSLAQIASKLFYIAGKLPQLWANYFYEANKMKKKSCTSVCHSQAHDIVTLNFYNV